MNFPEPQVNAEALRVLVLSPDPSDTVELRHLLGDRVGMAGIPQGRSSMEIDHVEDLYEGLAQIQAAQVVGRPYAIALIDLSDSLSMETLAAASRLWEVCPELEVALCHDGPPLAWQAWAAALGRTDQWIPIRRPWDPGTMVQWMNGLARHWRMTQERRVEYGRLEDLVRERTQGLRSANQRLREDCRQAFQLATAAGAARQSAEATSQAKSEFLSIMSHEIRTPMCGVLGYASLLLEGSLDGEQRTYAENIRNSGELLLNLLNDILDWSKLEAGKLGIEPAEFDLSKAIKEVIALTAFRAQEKNLHLVAVYPVEVPHRLYADPGRVRQVLLNLVSNALKFTSQGSVTIRVSEIPDTRPGRVPGAPGLGWRHSTGYAASLRVEVIDTGIGIAKAHQSRLFQRFHQADDSISRRYGGTGLGLSISKQLVELMGGQVGLESEPDRGSTFWFTLPLLEPGEPAVLQRNRWGRRSSALAFA
jgi:signal transduction histidine kinase